MGWNSEDFLPGASTATHSTAQGNEDIDALSERLTTLAARITETNAPKRGDRLPPKSPKLPKRLAGSSPARPSALPVPPVAGRDSPVPLNSDAQGRQWPQLPVPPQPQAKQPEQNLLKAKLAEQTEELARRHAQIADLSDIQQAQAGDLLLTRDHIIRLNNTIADLQRQNAERNIEIASNEQRRIQAENENVELRTLLDAALKSSAQLSKRLLDNEMVLNDRIVDVTAGEDTIERLSAKLAATQARSEQVVAAARAESQKAITAAQAEIATKVAAAEEKADRLYSDERQLLMQRHETRVNALQSRIVECDRHAELYDRAYAELAACCDGLSGKTEKLQGLRDQDAAAIKTQREQIEFLETVMKVERANAEATIQEMIAEFQREQQRIQAQEQASAEIRKNIVQLLPKLLERRHTVDNAKAIFEMAEPHSQQVA